MSATLEFVSKRLTWLGPGVSKFLEKRMKAIPAVRKQIEKQYDGMTDDLEKSLKPYKGNTEAFVSLPTAGINRDEVLKKCRNWPIKSKTVGKMVLYRVLFTMAMPSISNS
ncbi:MAG: hypothetical protein M0D57_06225 [Sphingobacteriales bacterium JAD_PAG50586_3]|nr:MAG: hypothetical protein M0D57_06225 [Sphingobacteriales bacterium JAD_PAG50586_3]